MKERMHCPKEAARPGRGNQVGARSRRNDGRAENDTVTAEEAQLRERRWVFDIEA